MRRALWTLAVLLSHWRRHPMQLATLLIGLISATALWSGVQALNQQARTSYDRAAATFGGTRTAMLVGQNSSTFPQQLFIDLRRAGWPVSPVLEGRIQIEGRSFRLLGIEPVTLPAEVGNAPAIGKANLQSFMTPPGEMLVARETLSDLKLAEGARPQTVGGAMLPPLRVQPQLVPGVLVVDIGIAQSLLKMPDQLSRLLIGKATGKRASLESIAGDRLRLIEPSAETDLERLTDSFHLNLTAFGLLSFFVGLFIVNSAIGLAFEQRLPILRTLRACGVSARMLNAVLVAELVSLALVAGLIGLVCGYFIAAALLPDVAASLRGLYGAQIPGQLTLKPQWWIAGIAISILGALAAAAASLTKALRMPLLATAQPYAWQQAQRRWLTYQSALALAAFAAAGGLLWFGDSLISGFAVLAALMLGAALILPMFLELVLSFGQRHARRPLSVWFWADSRQQLSGLSLALMALLLALAVNVGVSTMVESFSRTFLVWLDGRLAADVYISAANDAQATEIKAWLRERPEVEAILPGGRADTQLAGAPIEVLGLPDHAIYRDNWPLLQSADNRLEQAASRRYGPCQRTTGPSPETFGWRSHRGPRVGRKLAAQGSRHLCRLWQPEGPDRGQFRCADAALSGNPADANGIAGRAAENSGADLGAAGKVRARRSQRRRSGDDEGGIDPDIQPHLCSNRGAECLHARCRRHCAVDQPADIGQFAPAATGAAVGDRRHAAAARRHRTFENDVGGADHHHAGASAGIAGGVVPARDRQRQGVRLAAAVSRLPDATALARRRRDGGCVRSGGPPRHQAGAHAAGEPDQDLCQ